MYDDLIHFVRKWYGTEEFIPLHEPRFDQTDKDFVADAIDSTFVSSVGAYVDQFEKELAEYMGVKRSVVTVNGTAALQVALKLAGVQKETEVILQAFTFIATANAIAYNNAHPVFIDVDRDTLGLSPDNLRAFLDQHCEKRNGQAWNKTSGRRISAILPMHTFGLPCRVQELCRIGEEWGIPVVEDAAESIGSTIEGKHCGTFGLLGILSFNGNKTITSGGGGAIVTNDTELADKAKHLTTTAKVPHKWEFIHDETGFNYRMPNLNAALACAQLRHLPNYLSDKKELAGAYRELFSNCENVTFIDEPAGTSSNFWLNAVLLPDREQRDLLLETLNDAGVMCRPPWQLMTQLDMYKDSMCDNLENSIWLEDRVVNIPSSARKL